jgi:hypothetical protein
MMANSDRSDNRTSVSWLTRLFRSLRGGGKGNKGVRSGDRFGKVAELFQGTQTTWRVWGTVDFVDMAHVKLIQEEPPHRIVTVSLSTLLDKRFYRRLASAAEDRLPDPPALPATRTNNEEARSTANLHSQPETMPVLDQTADAGPVEDVIRFVGPEGRAGGVSKTNPFSKARTAKRRAENKTTGVTH